MIQSCRSLAPFRLLLLAITLSGALLLLFHGKEASPSWYHSRCKAKEPLLGVVRADSNDNPTLSRDITSVPPDAASLFDRRTPLQRLRDHSSRVGRRDVGEYGWRLHSYVPSDLESDWKTAVKAVEHLPSFKDIYPQFKDRIDRLVTETAKYAYIHNRTSSGQIVEQCLRQYNSSVQAQEYACGGDPSVALNASLWSRMVYRFECLVEPCENETLLPLTAPRVGELHTSYIEPLFGMMRHPSITVPDRVPYTDMLSKDYMLIDRWALHNTGTRWKKAKLTAKYFDLGASTYYDGGGGPSQSWFVDLAECMCLPMKDLWLWEAVPHNAKTALTQVPGHIKAGYHWFNIPLSSEEGSWDNPLNYLLEKVQVGDPVFFKVDFDTPAAENRIVEMIRDIDELSQRIDEFFFEHHVILFWMTPVWRNTINRSLTSTDTIQLFQDLRRKGIRAHSWV